MPESILEKRKIGKKLKIGMIFPGQGTQFLGMGKELYDSERIVQEAFEDASNCLNENFVKLCFSSSEEMLRGTIPTQTAIFLVSASIYMLLKDKYGIVPNIVAGHSLGEYTAVFAAGGMNFPDSLYLLKKRAVIMEETMKKQRGGMLAVLGLTEEVVQKICSQYDCPESNDSVVELVNYNSPSQFVVSGTLDELELVKKDVEVIRGKAIFLPVAGAFHSRMLRKAEELFSMYLLKVDFNPLQIPLINNVMAVTISSPSEIKLSLVKQTSSHIYWWASMEKMRDCDLIIETGPNNKFAKIIKREWPNKPIISINSQQDIEELLKLIEKLEIEKN